MTGIESSQEMTLEDWERVLRPQVRRFALLGELEIKADDCAHLGTCLGLRLAALGPKATLTLVRRDYPCSFAAYLVAQGVYGYKGGDYWGEVCKVTGLSQRYTWRWGQLFLRILQDLELTSFPDMPGQAQAYVAPILAHGGIPNYCLRDFFEKVLKRAVTQPEYADITASEVAEQLQDTSAYYFIDKPVLRFLQYGGGVAEDFFRRCREMATEYVERDIVPSAEQMGLPTRVVSAYEQWVIDDEERSPPTRVVPADRLRLRRPDILFDPWGEGMILLLHPQRVPVSFSEANLSWVIKTDHANFGVPVRVRRSGGDLETTSDSVLLRRPSGSYEISFQVNDEPKRTWRYPGTDGDHPLLVFRADSGAIMPVGLSVPAATLWLLFPADLRPEFEGEARCLEEFPRLPGFWAEYRGQCWDMTNARGFSLVRADDSILRLAVRPDENALRPYCVGGQLFATSHGHSSTVVPTYIGCPPCIRVPRSGRRELEETLSGWRLRVHNDGPGHPQIDVKVLLAELRSDLEVNQGYVDVPLGMTGLLGRRAFGAFTVRIQGPMGRRADLPLRVLPPVVITGHESLYLPDPEYGPPAVTLLVTVGEGMRVECEAEGEDCSLLRVEEDADKRRTYVVRVSPGATIAELVLVSQVSAQESVHIPLAVPIRRLRWALVAGQEGLAIGEWTAEVINRPIYALLHATAPSLLIDMPMFEDTTGSQLRLCLSDIEGVELQSQEARLPQRGQRFLRFDLGAYMDTVRGTSSPVLHFGLEGLAPLHERGVDRLPVLSLTQQLLVKDVELNSDAVDNCMRVELTWSEPMQLSHRCVRFWPIHRPWEGPYEVRVPDHALGEFTFKAPVSKLCPGKYRLEFLIVDPWAVPAHPQRPSLDTPDTVEVGLVSIGSRLDQISRMVEKKGGRFSLLLERALILREAGDAEAAREDLDWCFLHLGEGAIPEVLALAEVLRDEGDTDLFEPLRYMMFAPARVEDLLHAREEGWVSPRQLQAYLSYLPEFKDQPLATLVTLLGIRDVALRLRASGELVRRSAIEGMDIILEWVAQGSLSDHDALDLCGLNPEFAFDHLEHKAANPIAHRLLLQLSKQELGIVYAVRPGIWIYSDAGWGRIDRIKDSSSGTQVEAFIKSKLDYRLEVTLRPDGDAEPVVIDLQSGIIAFVRAEGTSTCTKCYRFSASKRNWGVITDQHNRAVHGGIGPRFVYEDQRTKALHEWRFSNVAPRNQFA